MGFSFYQLGVLPGVPNRLEVDRDGMTVREFICQMGKEYRTDVSRALQQLASCDDGELRMVTINGVNIDKLDGLDTIIPADCELAMFHVIAGG